MSRPIPQNGSFLREGVGGWEILSLAIRRNLPLLATGSLLLVSAIASAQTDHDNIDAGRPLRFEDAEPIAFRGMALEFGLAANFPRRGSTAFELPIAFVYGAALNGQLEFGLHTGFGGGEDFDLHEVEVAYLHSFSMETVRSPAFALKGSVSLPANGSDESERLGLRAIWTKAARQYDRFHLNLDGTFVPDAREGEREALFDVILGYTRPIGYPRHFDTTAVAEIAALQGRSDGEGTTLALGLGLRRQLNPRAVLDLGIQSDVAPGKRSDSTPFRLVAGYSFSF